ncbi:MAG TPA: SH3 domain-containing protein [Dehalococcoidia bacterium]|nr:SH3 domain-containing protein [Dehalococcoidia bacterium]
MTSENQRPAPGARPPRRQKPEPPVDVEAAPSADQGDLWADTPASSAQPPAPELPTPVEPPPDVETDLDSFISDLPPPDEADEFVAPPAAVRAPGARRRATAATSLAARPEPAIAEAYEYEDAYYDAESDYSMLRNPYVLAGLAVAIAIVAAVFVVILFGSGGGNGGFEGGVVSRPLTPEPGDDGGIKGLAVQIAAVREGPGRDYFEIGLLRSGHEVSVVGRNADSTWYEIIYPDSDLEGWVQASALKLPENAASLISVVNFTPIPKPSVVQPTATSGPVATPTGEAGPAPDLELATLGGQCPTGEPITLALRNVGSVPVNGRQVNVIVTTQSGVVSQSTIGVTLAPGQAVPVSTGQVAQPPRTTVSVLFASAPQDSNPSNNVVVCTVGSGGSGGPGGGSTAVPPPIGSTPDDD